jgi:hypothetical protein
MTQISQDIREGPYRSAATRARIATRLLTAIGLVSVIAAAIGIYGIAALAGVVGGSSSAEPFTVFTVAFAALSFLFFAFELVTAVAFLAWLSRAVDNVAALGGGKPPRLPSMVDRVVVRPIREPVRGIRDRARCLRRVVAHIRCGAGRFRRRESACRRPPLSR